MKFSTKLHLNHSVCEISPLQIKDDRGFFSEIYQKNNFNDLGIKDVFVQENQSFSNNKNTFRGLHLQKPPYEQAKLIRVLKGEILDIAVDLRRDSPTYMQHKFFTLSEENFKQVYIPIGFAHGFLTLEDNCQVLYKVSNFYNHDSDVSISLFDKELNISLPCRDDHIILSDKDKNGIMWSSIGEIF